MPTSLLDMLKGVDLEYSLTEAAVLVALIVLVLSTFALRRQRPSFSSCIKQQLLEEPEKRDKKMSQGQFNTKSSSAAPAPSVTSCTAPVDVWAERIAKGVAPASLNHKAGAGEAKPFGSSYYYAHNNSKTSGGYKDGLRMEDYTMNGPRLLSRNGSAVSLEEPVAACSDSQESHAANADANDDQMKDEQLQKASRTIIPISKYLWDDTPTIGTIRIDQLPLPNGDLVAWRDLQVLDHRSELTEKGLLVTLTTSTDVEYRLHIRALYAAVVTVKTSVAKGNKRLLVKLSKTKRQDWPHPQARVL
ncbi:hypothetical protein MPSEU_000229200 [Mayamaea pseudoterrestris]|nr:hypothetical protein MPSEU_000229200 [Mayamaea pseudoterrestris]